MELVSNLTYKKPNGTTIADFSYSYDSMGRIVSDGAYHYSYDSLGQLITVTDNAGHTVESYVYDGAGNILSATKDGTTHSYSYGDSEWKDLLTGYDGQSITYDAIGNPTGYLGNTLTWQNGRELASYSNSTYSISYSYDVNGLRTEKAVTQIGATTSYQYFYNGSTLLQERIDNGTGTDTVLNFIYTADGKPYALEYSTNNGSNYTTYYYLTNLQGDVVSVLNSSGTAVVTYSYDSWGQITQTTGSLATTLGKDNPLRYRGYVYDEETSLYYLQSRYYDPQICRFINADSYASTGQGFVGCNMFAYCNNDSVGHIDANGKQLIALVESVYTTTEDESTYHMYLTISVYDDNLAQELEQLEIEIIIEYSDGIIHIDNKQENAGWLIQNSIDYAIAAELLTIEQLRQPLEGRTKKGLAFEMLSHYILFCLRLELEHTEVTDIGSTNRNSRSYDSNACYFEHPIKAICSTMSEKLGG